VILGDMSPSDISKLDSFLGGIWATRNQWSVAHNLEVQAFDLRVNTFTEAQFSVLTQHVGVSASMSAPTFVRAEDLVQLHRQNKLMLQNFKQSTRRYSHTTQAKEWFVAVEEMFCPKPLKMQKQEVELASECVRSARTQVKICRGDMCPTCTKYMTPRQKTLKEISQETITIHARCHVLDKKKQVTFASLPVEIQNEIRKAPKEKNWRVVTCHKYQNGWLILCSCGWSMRNMMGCLHCSMVVQMSTNFEFCGCEEESLSIRHTHAYAGIQNLNLIQATHDDWKGVYSTVLSADLITAACERRGIDGSDSSGSESSNASEPKGDGDHSHRTRQANEKRQAIAAARARKSEGLAQLRAHFQEILNVIEVENREHEYERLLQDGEQRLHDWRIHLPPVPARSVTARARRPHAEERQKGPRRGPKHRKSFATKSAKEGAAQRQVTIRRARAHHITFPRK
jgi:hypothetical protein